MILVKPMSEDFFYWDPEEICDYPNKPGIEDHWFVDEDLKPSHNKSIKASRSREVMYAG